VQEKEKEIEVQDIYSGPWIERRIEYKVNDDKHHEIIAFGSWNGFRESVELERQGNQIYAFIIKLPLGSWVYRFQVDKQDWETNDETAKTIKNGIEFNTITIKEKEEIEEEEEEIEEKNDSSNLKKLQNTQVIFDESSQKFVVGKKNDMADQVWN